MKCFRIVIESVRSMVVYCENAVLMGKQQKY